MLGILLLLYPVGLADSLGLPPFSSSFYPSILGAVLLGIGLALFIERYGKPVGMIGLGIAGAVIINICGGLALLFWLLFGGLISSGRVY